ncbi:MAG: hypothetical protein LBH43_20440 [Treponema sp.]|jgi:hypothetical protein|nr:hypothetical protein [Treponema sp.]
MKKKLVLALLMSALLAGGAFAQFSAGFGGTFTADFTTYSYTNEAKDILKALGMPTDMLNTNTVGGGFFAYFDAVYVMASLGMGFHGITPANSDLKKVMDEMKQTMSLNTFEIELLGKFPFAVGGMSIFPLLGLDIKLALAYDMTLDGEKFSYTSVDGNKLSDLNTIWGKFGFGADIPLGYKTYLRPILLYGVGTTNKDQKAALDAPGAKDLVKAIVNYGLDIKIAFDFKF